MALHICKNPEDILINRQTLAKNTLPLSQWVLPGQKHTANIRRVTQADAGKGSRDKETAIENTDALYTTEENLLIGVFTADCLGIVLADETIPLVCTVHSGWRGTAQAILHKTLVKLKEEGLLHPETLQVYFSPSLLKASLEVGMEVIEAMKPLEEIDINVDAFHSPELLGKCFLDNQGLNIQMCLNMGIPKQNIHPSVLDTKKEAQCFSFRVERENMGEHFTYAFIKQRDVPN